MTNDPYRMEDYWQADPEPESRPSPLMRVTGVVIASLILWALGAILVGGLVILAEYVWSNV